MQRSPIQWTDFTSNPIQYRNAAGKIVWACVHCSPGCLHCYAEQLAKRFAKGGPFNVSTTDKVIPFLNLDECEQMRRYKPASGKRCFIGDMTDIFGEWVPDDLLNQLFSNVLEMREDVQWQILTKRADRMQKYLSWRYGEGRIPMRNIWCGVSVENQQYADERIPILLKIPAAVRFVSYEPALGPVEFDCGPGRAGPHRYFSVEVDHPEDTKLDWVIVGGESGPGARPFNLQWARDVVAQCRAAGVACFVKQLGQCPYEKRPADGGPHGTDEALARIGEKHPQQSWFRGWTLVHTPNGESNWYRYYRLKDRKGGDPSEWPAELRVREFPR